MMSNIIHLVSFAKKWGVLRTTGCLIYRLAFHLLRFFYRFDPWHANTPYACREYKWNTLLLASLTTPQTVVDIGCGLGEIVSRIPVANRYGFDREEAVIRAARLLYGSKVCFEVATLLDVDVIRRVVCQNRVDLLIMTGWTHGVKIEELRAHLKTLNSVLPIDIILIDALHPSKMDKRGQYHSAEKLQLLGKVINSMDADNGARQLHLVKLNLVDAY